MVKSNLANEKEIFNKFVKHENLRKLRVSFDSQLGQPVWWVSFRPNGNAKLLHKFIQSSYEIWNDPRVKRFRHSAQIYSVLKKRFKEKRPFLFIAGGMRHFCVPLIASDKNIGYLCLSDVRKNMPQETCNLLTGYLQVVLDNCAKSEELERLSATIRPRAIALSTVHTVHRIINSTLNLDELVSRLAHLTAQVLRANRCMILLVDGIDKSRKSFDDALQLNQSRKKKFLICKALVGYPKGRIKEKKLPFGTGIEGRVAQTAGTVLRKKFISIPLIDDDVIGVMTVSLKKDNSPFTYFDQEILTTLAEEAVIAIKNAQLYEEQKKVTLGTIQSLAVILGTRLPDNAPSPQAMLELALKIAEELRLSEEDTQALHYATLLKDTAKLGIPDEILRKPTKLTGEEYRLIREHPIKGAKVVQSFESLKSVVPIILYSREKYDGTGYPKGLKGEKIPIGARILSVLNAFEAIIIGRPYRDRSSLKEAVDEISKNSGTQFDPKIVEVFLRIISRFGFGHFLKNEANEKKR